MIEKKPPTISVVMSVYNDSEFVGSAIESILSQTFRDFELVIIDDGSKDNSRQVVERYAERDSRIRLIVQKNSGLTQALIRGCSEARGQFVARHDSDDVSLPTRFEKQLDLFQRTPEAVVVGCWSERVEPFGQVFGRNIRPIDPQEATALFQKQELGPAGHGSAMFRKDVYHRIGGYRSEFRVSQDFDLWLRFSEMGLFAYVPEVLYRYRYDGVSISVAKHQLQKRFGELARESQRLRLAGQSDKDVLETCRTLCAQETSGTLKDPNATAAGYYLIGRGLQDYGNPGAAYYFWKSAVASPMYWRSWVRLAQSLFRVSKRRS